MIPALLAGIVVGAALGAGGCARAEREKERAAPVLPASRVNYARPATRQIFFCGTASQVETRTNSYLREGWRVVPGTVAAAGDQSYQGDNSIVAAVLEYKPALPKR